MKKRQVKAFPERYRDIITKAQLRADAKAFKKQLNCKHPKISEAPYSPNSCGNSLPDFRVCLVCGFTERGWSCGYQILKGRGSEVGNLSRDEAYRIRVGPTHENCQFVRVGDCVNKTELYEMALREAFGK